MSYANAISVGWADFRGTAVSRGLSIQCLETASNYYLLLVDGLFSVRCDLDKTDPVPAGSDQEDFETNFKSKSNRPPKQEVTTQLEKNDKTLKLASAVIDYDTGTNLATAMLKVPGTFGGFGYGTDGRHVAGGYAFQDTGAFGDRCKTIEIADQDNLIGYGAGAVLKAYHDTDIEPEYAGWRMYPAPQTSWEIEIDPIGGYGFLPAGLYLKIVFEKLPASPATKVAVNIWWGKIE